jgi:hypothetical protein
MGRREPFQCSEPPQKTICWHSVCRLKRDSFGLGSTGIISVEMSVSATKNNLGSMRGGVKKRKRQIRRQSAEGSNDYEVREIKIGLEGFLAPYDMCQEVREMSDTEMIKCMLKKNKKQNLALMNLLKIVKKLNGK